MLLLCSIADFCSIPKVGKYFPDKVNPLATELAMITSPLASAIGAAVPAAESGMEP
jgi:hypothetical protein